jgi:hypothetical protein
MCGPVVGSRHERMSLLLLHDRGRMISSGNAQGGKEQWGGTTISLTQVAASTLQGKTTNSRESGGNVWRQSAYDERPPTIRLGSVRAFAKLVKAAQVA